MSHFGKHKLVWTLLAAALAGSTNSALACAACFGRSDSPLAKGMNWGIFSLLVMVVFVLASVAGFFVFLARKSAAFAARSAQDELMASTQKA
jgi:heme/copper-type cytochrome/quinol oxidase subunit 2